jgi:SH3 domain protein
MDMNKKQIQKNANALSSYRVALILAIFVGTMVFTCVNVLASSLYVAPTAEIAIRRGQGTEYKIVAMVKDGVKVEVIEESEFYKKVRTRTGREGWVLSRFLSPNPPLDSVVEKLREEKKTWQGKSTIVNQKIEELTLTVTTTQEELNNLRREREELAHDYETLQRDTADVVQIKQDLERTAGENGTLLEKLAVVEEQYNALKKDSTMYWFLTGAGVLIVGIILGKMPGPSRRRKSSLL